MTETTKRDIDRKRGITLFLLIVVAICLFVFLGAPLFKDEATREKEAAFAAVYKEVRGQLASPASARFPSSINDEGVGITNIEEGIWIIAKSWVDAQNTYGTYVRRYITAKLEKKGNKFTVIDCWLDMTNPYK